MRLLEGVTHEDHVRRASQQLVKHEVGRAQYRTRAWAEGPAHQLAKRGDGRAPGGVG